MGRPPRVTEQDIDNIMNQDRYKDKFILLTPKSEVKSTNQLLQFKCVIHDFLFDRTLNYMKLPKVVNAGCIHCGRLQPFQLNKLLLNKHKGRIIVLSNEKSYMKSGTEYTFMCLAHNHTFMSTINSVLKSTTGRCDECRKASDLARYIPQVYNKFNGNIEVIPETYEFKKTPTTRFICHIHKIEFTNSITQALNTDYFCPMCRKEASMKSQETFISESQEVWGKEGYIYTNTKYQGSEQSISFICPFHGEVTIPKASSHILSTHPQGCPICSKTRGETKIHNLLKSYSLPFKSEFKFKDCKDKGFLRFDFAVKDINNKIVFLIEYDGEGHFYPVSFGGMSYSKALTSFLSVLERDKIKNKYCEDNNISLLRIPYWRFKDIEEILERELKARKIL